MTEVVNIVIKSCMKLVHAQIGLIEPLINSSPFCSKKTHLFLQEQVKVRSRSRFLLLIATRVVTDVVHDQDGNCRM